MHAVSVTSHPVVTCFSARDYRVSICLDFLHAANKTQPESENSLVWHCNGHCELYQETDKQSTQLLTGSETRYTAAELIKLMYRRLVQPASMDSCRAAWMMVVRHDTIRYDTTPRFCPTRNFANDEPVFSSTAINRLVTRPIYDPEVDVAILR